MKYFDSQHNRLVYIKSTPSEEFWSKHWLKGSDFEKRVRLGARRGLVKIFTEKFLPKAARVIDAGCGISQNVYGLKEWGYDAYGVDFTDKVIKKTKEFFPELNVSVQDVRNLNFPGDYFDGYWSVGVIEHFTEGYSSILEEAWRMLKKDGYLFLTVPWFSPLRKLKAKFGSYSKFSDKIDMKNFYEFMLDEKQTVANIESIGFTFVSKYPFDAVKGLKDEIPLLRPLLQKIYDGRNVFARALRYVISILFASFAGHIILLVFKKRHE